MKQPSAVLIAHTTDNKLVKGGGFTFSRNSIGFSKGLNDVLESEPVNEPRIYKRGGHISSLSEKSSTNNYLYSSEFDNAVHTKANTVIISEDTEVAPNGKLEADALMPLTETPSHRYIQQNINLSTGDYTFSVYVKSKGERYIRLTYNQNASPYALYGQATYDLQEGTVFNTVAGKGRSEYFGNGWWRISITGTSTASSSQFFKISLGDDVTESGSLEDGILLWGGQVEATSAATSLKETTSSSETREADRMQFAVPDTDELTHKTYYFNLNFSESGNGDSQITFTDGTDDNRVQVRSHSGGQDIMVYVEMDGEVYSDYVDVGSYENDVKIALSFSDNVMNVSVNGEIATSNTFTNISFGSALSRFVNGNTSLVDDSTKFEGLINEVMVFPMTLSNAEINLITTL